MKPTLIIISGMHRSSTSLITQHLQLCGLCLGNNLLGTFRDNEDGYFENKTIVHSHQLLIQSKNEHMFTLLPQETYPDDVKLIITSEVKLLSETSHVVGFKDPRNSLFINPLNDLFVDAKNLMVYRIYEEVIDSLIRRKTDKILRFRPWIAAKAWIRYNEELVKFYDQNKSKSLLFIDSSIIKEPELCIHLINQKFDISLRAESINKIYKSHLTKRDASYGWKTKLACFLYRGQLNETLQKLEERRAK
jgi:hypothetical protein